MAALLSPVAAFCDLMLSRPVESFALQRVIIQPLIASVVARFFVLNGKATPSQRRLVSQRLARTVSGLTLTICATYALLTDMEMWKHPWLADTYKGRAVIKGQLAYLLVDLLELLWAYARAGTPLQPDLMVHHIAGLYFFGRLVAQNCGMWYAVLAVNTELLTLFSGSVFFFALLDHDVHPLAKFGLKCASKLRLWCILCVRFPIWILLNYFIIAEWSHPTDAHDPERQLNAMVQCALCVGYSLDTYWSAMLLGFFKSKGELARKKAVKISDSSPTNSPIPASDSDSEASTQTGQSGNAKKQE
mmetsp:Transcript_65624/g.155018  ORF Transcript_65624/g.155018 Transcript_65624/m.155018 type:complete len:303 (+) Transcript_65624:40-948(+)